MRVRFLSMVALAAAVPAAAQQGSAVSGIGAVYAAGKDNLMKSAEQVSEEIYAFKPTPEVRSFGAIIAHVANANFMICSMAKGESNPNAKDFEKTTTAKAELVTALKESFAYCDGAMQMADAKAMEETTLFGMKTNRMGVLAFNAGHNFEHYGNLVTYMRLKGIVPPSSQRGM